MSYNIYCLSYKYLKKDKMIRKFSSLGFSNIYLYDGVDTNDIRINNRNLDENTKKCFSICYGHLDMIREFYTNTSLDIGIFCEDDILIHQKFPEILPTILNDFTKIGLDVLLLGYLCYNPIENTSSTKICSGIDGYDYYNYSHIGTWGTQMYMISRTYAKKLLDIYSIYYADESLKNTNMVPFSADWTITKDGKRGLIYPLLVIEDYSIEYNDIGQDYAHSQSYNFSYNENFI